MMLVCQNCEEKSRYLPDILIPIVQLKEIKEEEEELPSEENVPPRRKRSVRVKTETGTVEKGVTKKGSIRVKAEFKMTLEDEDEKFECPICKSDIKRTLKEMKTHYKLEHVGKRLRTASLTNELHPCIICGKEMRYKSALREHMEIHNNSYSCEHCGASHEKSSEYVIHMEQCEMITGLPMPVYDCPICNEHYTSALALKRHQRTKHELHGPQVSVLCDICGKSLSSKEKLKFHRRIHTGFKPHGCEICSKSFSRKDQLKEHERVHTGTKPYKCGFCEKRFSQRSPMCIHERTHTGERPYICRLCGRGFISRGVMNTHMKNCSV